MKRTKVRICFRYNMYVERSAADRLYDVVICMAFSHAPRQLHAK